MSNQNLNFCAVDERKGSARPKQRNDCAIRACVSVFGIDYDYIFHIFARAGRKSNCCTPRRITNKFLASRATVVFFAGGFGPARKKPIPLKEVVRQYPSGRYVLSLTRHHTALIEGEIWDLAENNPDRITYWSDPSTGEKKKLWGWDRRVWKIWRAL